MMNMNYVVVHQLKQLNAPIILQMIMIRIP